jgi:DNA-binding beta-propeller fold protein YncE
MKNLLSFGALFLSLFVSGGFVQAQTKGYHLIKKTVIGGEGGWDYLTVDHEGGKLFLSHGSQVEVRDLSTHKSLGVIKAVNGVHGIAAVPKYNRGITTNGRSNTATIFNLKTLAPIVELPTGENPDALLYDAYSDRVFVFNHSGSSATAIDLSKGIVLGTVDLGGDGVEAGVSDGQGTIFVNLEDTHEIVSFDAKTLAVKTRWSVAPGEEPTGLAINTQTHRLFSVCGNELMLVVDETNGKIISKVPIGKHVDGVVFDPGTKLAVSSNGEGSITVVKEVSATEYSVVETVPTAPGARTLALDPVTHHIFVSTAQYGAIPAATSENPNPRPGIVPGTFMLLEFGQD